MMYHPIKPDSKKDLQFSRHGRNNHIFDYVSPHCDPELEDSKVILLHDTLAHDDASPYQVWLQKVQQLRRYRPDEHLVEFWTFPVTLT